MSEELGFEEKLCHSWLQENPRDKGECDDSVLKIMQNEGQGGTDQDFNRSQNGKQIQNSLTRNSRMPLGN